jgi:hypothetical protein
MEGGRPGGFDDDVLGFARDPHCLSSSGGFMDRKKRESPGMDGLFPL